MIDIEDDTIVVRWTGKDARPHQIRFEPRASGGWRRIEQRWNGNEWVRAGSEIVNQVGLDAPAAVVVDGQAPIGD